MARCGDFDGKQDEYAAHDTFEILLYAVHTVSDAAVRDDGREKCKPEHGGENHLDTHD